MKYDIQTIKNKQNCIDVFNDAITEKTEHILIIQKYMDNIPMSDDSKIRCENQIKNLQIWVKKHLIEIYKYEIQILQNEIDITYMKEINKL